MNTLKRIAFVFLCFAVCGIVYFLIALNQMMSSFLTGGDTSIVRWAAVITLSAFILFFIWRRMKSAYKSLWLIEKQKEKPKIANSARLEIPETEVTESYIGDKQNSSSSRP